MKKSNKLLAAGAIVLGCAPMVLVAAQQIGQARIAFADDKYTIILDMDGKQDNITLENVSEGEELHDLLYNCYMTTDKDLKMLCETDDAYLFSFVDRSPDSFKSREQMIDYALDFRDGLIETPYVIEGEQKTQTFYSVWIDYEQDYIFDRPRNFKIEKEGVTNIPTASLCGGNMYLFGGRCTGVTISYEFSPLTNINDDNNYTNIEMYDGVSECSYGIIDEEEFMLSDVNPEEVGNKKFLELAGETFNYVYIDNVGTEEQYTQYGTNKFKDKIAIVNRGTTTFGEKVTLAISYGASGVIVVNNQPGLVHMSVGAYQGQKPVASAFQEARLLLIGAGTKETISGVDYYTGSFEVGSGTREYYEPAYDYYPPVYQFAPTYLGGDGTFEISGIITKMADPSAIHEDDTYYSDLTITIESFDDGYLVTDTQTFHTTVYWKYGSMYTTYYNANGGTGEQDNDRCLDERDSFCILAACTFTAPENMEFDFWEVNGGEYHPGDELVMDGDKVIYAVWKDAGQGGGGDSEGGDSEGGDTPTPTPEQPKAGLPAGAIVGIVIGSVLVVGLGGFAIFWFVIKKKSFKDLIAVFKKKQ